MLQVKVILMVGTGITIMNTDAKSLASMSLSQASLLSLLHISSPALPVGAFAYSQGLEYALDAGWCHNRADVQAWIEDNLKYGLGQLDLPVFLRMHQAWSDQDLKAVNRWNQTLLAFRESKELYLEDVQVGSAYAQWHLGQDAEREKYLKAVEKPTVVTMSALASVLGRIDKQTALLGFVWSWVENQIAAASKAMPMGQTDGQTILKSLIPNIVEVCNYAESISDEEIGTGLMGVAMASSLHEQQYSRLFRS